MRALDGADWHSANETGLVHAKTEDWHAAEAAFRHAVASAPTFRDAPETHAVLLGNLAQAQFHCGDPVGAVETSRRALAARMLSCEDELDAPMARIRADLAVYLAACGEHAESEATLTLARQAIEARFGDVDERLLTILENQARLAIAAGNPAIAEPVLLRLHALLTDTGSDPARLSPLLARIALARRDSAAQGAVEQDTEEAEVVEAELVDTAAAAADIDVFPVLLDDDAFDLIDDDLHPPMRSPSAQTIRDAGLIEPGTHTTPTAPQQTNPLGFEVQYGIPQDVLLNGSSSAHGADDPEAPIRPSLSSDGGRDNPFW